MVKKLQIVLLLAVLMCLCSVTALASISNVTVNGKWYTLIWNLDPSYASTECSNGICDNISVEVTYINNLGRVIGSNYQTAYNSSYVSLYFGASIPAGTVKIVSTHRWVIEGQPFTASKTLFL